MLIYSTIDKVWFDQDTFLTVMIRCITISMLKLLLQRFAIGDFSHSVNVMIEKYNVAGK